MGQSPAGKFRIAASNSFVFNENKAPEVSYTDSTGAHNEATFTKKIPKGRTYRFGIFSSETSSKHFKNLSNEAERLSIDAKLQGMKKLIHDHRQPWEKLWSNRIKVEGNPSDQRDINLALYNLYSFIRERSGYSISPMGHWGLGYNGHIFWDAETWMFPPLLLLHPELARSMLNYRYNRLQAAKEKAKAHGFKGAMYPWESPGSGQEATPVWALTGPYEQHVTEDIAIACWNYYRITQDKQWLEEKGYLIMKAVANFWVSRVTKDADHKYHLNNVVGADEYAQNINDDAFSNGAAKKALLFAGQAAHKLGKALNPTWQKVANGIAIHTFNNGTIKEYASYDGKEIKKADVNLLSYPLNIITKSANIKNNLRYYEPKIGPGPTMSYSMFALPWSRLGNQSKAYYLFQKGYQPNQVPPFGVLAEAAGGSNPYFATVAGGMLQSVIFGFGRLKITNDGITQIHSVLPKGCKSLQISGVGIHNKTFSRNE